VGREEGLGDLFAGLAQRRGTRLIRLERGANRQALS
jgi:hypothetical protein